MTGRRTATNRIRGPQSALTDFLASNNISAAQIQADYDRRQREAEQQTEQAQATASSSNSRVAERAEQAESAATKKKRKRDQDQALAKIRNGKNAKKKKGKKGGRDADDDDDDDYDLSIDMYAKKKPLPGQLENCDDCGKRFTVTPYSKTGPNGGLLCVKCSKLQEAERKKDENLRKKGVAREKRRQVNSNLLDGIVQIGTRSLLQQCLKVIGDNIHHIDEFGDLPPSLLDQSSQLLSKKRLLTPRTLNFFVHTELDTIALYDCAYIESDDFIRIFASMPALRKVDLRCAGQFKDEVLDYIMERDVPIQHLRLDAANLVSKQKWIEYFTRCGRRLESLKLCSLEGVFDDDVCSHLVKNCPNLRRIKVRKCFGLGDGALAALSDLHNLEGISLQFDNPTSPDTLASLISAVGPGLQTLSLEGFLDADDDVLAAIRSSCSKLAKFRFYDNDQCTDKGFRKLFLGSAIPPLTHVDLSRTRDVNYENPQGPEEPIGIASAGFEALMEHSGSAIEALDIHSCRHISHQCLSSVFDGKKRYPMLKDVDFSFVPAVDTVHIAAMVKTCPSLRKVSAFACFNVSKLPVPRGLALIGVPDAQTSIIHEGEDDVDM